MVYSSHFLGRPIDITNLLITAENINVLKSKATVACNRVKHWLLQQQLVLNQGKTKYVIFSIKKDQVFDIIINNENVTCSKETKFLGITSGGHIHFKRGGASYHNFFLKIPCSPNFLLQMEIFSLNRSN